MSFKVIRATAQMVGSAHPTRPRMVSLWGLRMRSNRRAASLNILGEIPNSRHWQLVASVAQQQEASPKSAICADESSDPLSVVAYLTFCGKPLGLRPPAPVPVPPATRGIARNRNRNRYPVEQRHKTETNRFQSRDFDFDFDFDAAFEGNLTWALCITAFGKAKGRFAVGAVREPPLQRASA
jgi:hypothetical protein